MGAGASAGCASASSDLDLQWVKPHEAKVLDQAADGLVEGGVPRAEKAGSGGGRQLGERGSGERGDGGQSEMASDRVGRSGSQGTYTSSKSSNCAPHAPSAFRRLARRRCTGTNRRRGRRRRRCLRHRPSLTALRPRPARRQCDSIVLAQPRKIPAQLPLVVRNALALCGWWVDGRWRRGVRGSQARAQPRVHPQRGGRVGGDGGKECSGGRTGGRWACLGWRCPSPWPGCPGPRGQCKTGRRALPGEKCAMWPSVVALPHPPTHPPRTQLAVRLDEVHLGQHVHVRQRQSQHRRQ